MKIPCNRPAGGTATGVTATGGGSAPPLYREALVVFAGNSDIWWLGGLKVTVRSGRGMGAVKRISQVEAKPHKVLSFCW